MKFLYAHVSGIRLCFNGLVNGRTALLEQSKIMSSAFCLGRAYYPPGFFVGDDLGFKGVLLFLAGVVPALFFLGRSIGDSVTSMSMTSKLFSACSSFFFPGK